MILDSKRHKMKLVFENDFEMKHAKMLLKYQTYLLYDVEIILKSTKAYTAINYFFAKVKGNIPYKFF